LNLRSILPPVLFLFLASGAHASAPRVWNVTDSATLASAIAGSAAGDEIVLAHNAKPYNGPITLKESQKLTAAAGDPAPVITANDAVVITIAAGATIRNVAITGNGKAAGARMTGGNVTIDHCSFRDNASAIEVAVNENAAITVTSSRFQHNGAAIAISALTKSKVRVTLSKNTINETSASAISLFSDGTADLSATIAENQISGAVCGGGCDGIRITANGGSTLTAAIRDNVINGADESAIRALAGAGSASMALTIEANTVNAPGTAGHAIYLASGATKNDTSRVCAKIARNRLGAAPVRLLRGAPSATLALDPQRRFTTTNAAEAAVAAANGGASVKVAMRNGATADFATATCKLPE
jgi:hypothetical protein